MRSALEVNCPLLDFPGQFHVLRPNSVLVDLVTCRDHCTCESAKGAMGKDDIVK